jgi:hypothetical protein
MFKMPLLCSFKARNMLRAKSQDTLIFIDPNPRFVRPGIRVRTQNLGSRCPHFILNGSKRSKLHELFALKHFMEAGGSGTILWTYIERVGTVALEM